MLYREIMAVCSEIHTKHINTLCGQNVELLNVKLVVHTQFISRNNQCSTFPPESFCIQRVIYFGALSGRHCLEYASTEYRVMLQWRVLGRRLGYCTFVNVVCAPLVSEGWWSSFLELSYDWWCVILAMWYLSRLASSLLAVSGMAAIRVQPKCRCLTWECPSYGGTPTTSRTRATTVVLQSSVWHVSGPRSTTRHCCAPSTVPSPTSHFPMCSSCKYWEISSDAASRGNQFLCVGVHKPSESLSQDAGL